MIHAMWQVGERVDDDLHDIVITSSKPTRTKDGATVLRNFSMISWYYGEPWQPDKAVCDYVDSIGGWLMDERGQFVHAGNNTRVIDQSIVSGFRVASIVGNWLMDNRWCDGIMLEMIARKCVIPGWGEDLAWRAYYEGVLTYLQALNRMGHWVVTLNGRHDGFVWPSDLKRYADYNKLEGGLVWPCFPDDHHAHHDMAGGKRIESWDYWIERMKAFPSILEGFAAQSWGQEKVDLYTRIHGGLCAIYDAVCLRHVMEPKGSGQESHWKQANPWSPFYDSVAKLGRPTGNARRTKEIHWRLFEHGRMLVNPTLYPVRMAGVTVPAMDVVIG